MSKTNVSYQSVQETNHQSLQSLMIPPIQNEVNEIEPTIEKSKAQTDIEAFVNFVKGCIGTGVLAIPYAYKNAGYVPGSLILIFCGFLNAYTMMLLVGSLHRVCLNRKLPHVEYSYGIRYCIEDSLGYKKISKSAMIVVDSFLVSYQIGVCIIYHLFIAENLKQVVESIYPAWKMNGKEENIIRVYMLIVCVPLIAIILIRELKRLAHVSVIANICIFIGLTIIIIYAINELYQNKHLDGVSFKSIDTIPLFFGTAMFAYSTIGVVVSVESEMKHPTHFNHINGPWIHSVNISIITYTIIGLLGYVAYGDNVKDVIILNLPQQTDSGWAHAARFCCIISMYVGYPLNAHSIFTVLYERIIVNHIGRQLYVEYIVRVVFVFCTLIVGSIVPKLALIISLLGSICLPFLSFIFPAIMDYMVHQPNELGLLHWRVIVNFSIIMIGIFGFLISTAQTISQMIQTMQYKSTNVTN